MQCSCQKRFLKKPFVVCCDCLHPANMPLVFLAKQDKTISLWFYTSDVFMVYICVKYAMNIITVFVKHSLLYMYELNA